MEDKLIIIKGYSIVVTDEAFGFLQDIKGKENKHESEIGLMNIINYLMGKAIRQH